MRLDGTLDALCPTRSREWAVVEMAAVAGAVMVGAFARVPLQFTPVPFTLQTLPVLVAGYAVGPRRATGGMLLYLALGLAGAPVFANGFGPTFGYILGFAAVPWVTAGLRNPALGILTATLTIYALGLPWLCFWCDCSLGHGLIVGVLPFLPGDALKAVAAYRAARWIRR